MILAGDTGGTKTLLALFEPRGGALAPVREATFACADFPSLEAIVAEFLGADAGAGAGAARPAAACFGVAGPVTGPTARITNLPWTIDERVLSAQLGDVPVALLNDLQATALGTLVLPDDGFRVLQPPAQPAPRGAIAVIAPGTGLGEALLVWSGARHVALPSEGGHADFGPGTDEEIELLQYLRAQHGPHVSYERVLSGNGLGDLYGFARARSGAPEPAWLADALAAGDPNAVVAEAALAHRDPVCVHALAMFAEVLGAEAGNLALRGFATGGVVIGGGIPPRILPALETGALVGRFRAKGRFAPWLAGLGLRVALEPRAALLGAAHEAANLTANDKDRP